MQSPNFDRLRQALMLQGEPDRVPLFEASVDVSVKEGFLGHPIRTLADDVAFWQAAGYEHVPLSVGVSLVLELGPWVRASGDPRSGRLLNSGLRVSDPGADGAGLHRRSWAESGRGLITTMGELEAFAWPPLEQLTRLEMLDELARLLPSGMKILVNQGYIFAAVWQLMGFETFCYGLMDHHELVEALFVKVSSMQREVFDSVVDHEAVGAFFMPDDIAYSTALMVSPRVLRQHMFPYYAQICADCRRRDIPVIYHSDGMVLPVLDDIIACGFNGLHPNEPKAVDIFRLKEQVGDKLCLFGNLNLGGSLALGTPEDVIADTKELLRRVAPGGGYGCGSSNSVTEYVPLENYEAMRETVLRCGSYPIAIDSL